MPRRKTDPVVMPSPSARGFYAKLLVAGIIIIGGAYFVGTSDSGQINVSSAILSSNEANVANGGDPANNVPAPSPYQNMPNGGLVPSENQSAPEPTPVATPEATSTETNSTTTEVETPIE